MASGALVCVYRSRWAKTAVPLVRMARKAGLRVALWALDAEVPALAEFTVGTGPGQRLALLNRLLESFGSRLPDPVVATDDDIRFAKGDLSRLLRLARRAGFGLAQPAHSAGSTISIEITRRRRDAIARKTNFVEVGPLCVFRAPWSASLLPYPEAFGMGWGLDVVWSDRATEVPMGIVDAVTVEHLGPVGAAYDQPAELERLERLLAERGVASVDELATTRGTWPRRTLRPPWEVDTGL